MNLIFGNQTSMIMQVPQLPKSRIDIVDALRGFALFGIVIAHMNNQYYAGYPPPGHESMSVKNGFDEVLDQLSGIFIVGKFYTIFSFLFGLSFGIQLMNAQERNRPFIGRFAWRLLVLFGIALLHQMHYRGDILTIYATLGFFLLIFNSASTKWLLIWAFIFLLNIPGVLYQLFELTRNANVAELASEEPSPGYERLKNDATAYYNHVKAGDYRWIIKENILHEFDNKFLFQLFSGRLFITIGLFLLGLYMARIRLFEQLTQYRQAIRTWTWVSVIAVIVAVAVYFLVGLNNVTGTPQSIVQVLGLVFTGMFDPALSMIYVALFLSFTRSEAGMRRVGGLASLGRMGLTTYLVQTIFGLLLFYGYGLNMLDEIGNSISFPIGLAILLAQMFISKWWMKRYYYGPFEWFWRSATYLKWQPFRKKNSGTVAQ